MFEMTLTPRKLWLIQAGAVPAALLFALVAMVRPSAATTEWAGLSGHTQVVRDALCGALLTAAAVRAVTAAHRSRARMREIRADEADGTHPMWDHASRPDGLYYLTPRVHARRRATGEWVGAQTLALTAPVVWLTTEAFGMFIGMLLGGLVVGALALTAAMVLLWEASYGITADASQRAAARKVSLTHVRAGALTSSVVGDVLLSRLGVTPGGPAADVAVRLAGEMPNRTLAEVVDLAATVAAPGPER